MGFPGSSAGKESTCNAGLTAESERSPGERIGYPLQCSWGSSDGKEFACNVGNLGLIPGLGIPPGKGKCCIVHGVTCIVHGVAKSRTQLSDFHFTPYHTHICT